MAKKLDLNALLAVLPEIMKVVDTRWDALSDEAEVVAAKAKRAAKTAQKVAVKQAKNPVAQWIAVGLAAALVAGVAYALYRPDEDDLWQQAEDEADVDDWTT